MNSELRAAAPQQVPCKCCGTLASLYGVVDFNKNCEILRRKVLDLSGVPVYYHRCPACRFIFTTAFDHFTKEDFHRNIYNEEYLLVDPDYQAARPRANANFLCRLFAAARPPRLLDYGGGEGLLGELLCAAGFSQVETYDPFVPRHSTRPRDRFDCLVSFEVIEHSPDPVGTFAEINDLLTEDGLVLFSTLLQPANIDQQGLNWWYAGPRNGHVSLHSRSSLLKLVRPLGFMLASFNDNLHAVFRRVPDYAQSFLKMT